jgi:hypothetical protein
MADMVRTKPFRTGGSIAIRIPAGWIEAQEQVTLVRDPTTGRVYLTQTGDIDPQAFFDFLRGQPWEPDSGFADLRHRDQAPRPVDFDERV